ncbi:ABC transporter substrate-binding protein [Nocardiopsis ansamitocini]|uniref:Peptide ABC transporter substrate-binding protein n=1 Tax=Nocardiopsis ansamitocini TaxID=1670832 RepID=A0A9W6P7E8_9ACTN|nr:ABC transporter substrate-binding protein [Nocardiopsis ansamitocini]GLU48869.1 peptide ABC transporter substrate-binding protein [Nocardiopsis ansamitocini]
MKKRALGFIALGAASALLLSACGGSDGGGTGSGDAPGEFNQGATEVVNPSDATGGTLRYAINDDFDSTDPGNTYYGFSWNFSRYYARTLVTYKTEPGAASSEIVPDLAEEMPEPSDEAKTWTVKLKQGLKYEDGTDIVAEDIKYAIARSNYGGQLSKGPEFFAQLLDEDDYKGPYEDDDLDNFTAIETPDDHTLVFKLKESFSEFPYVLLQPQTAPVPAEADNGEQYQTSVLSSGPYKFDGDYEPGVKLNLTRNEEWDAESDPIRTALPDNITVELGVDQDEIDQRLVNGQLDVDLAGVGVGPAMKGQLVGDESKQAFLDNPPSGALRYVNINNTVIPDVACRQAIMYAANRDSLQRAWGGAIGGDIATQLMPPQLPGADNDYDPYPSEDNTGDLDAAKEKLKECGEEDGFSVNIAAREGRDNDIATAEALQESLSRVGIETSIKSYPASDFATQYAGSPDYVKDNDLGLIVLGWIPDWPTGYGFMKSIIDGRSIKDSGNYNMAEFDNKEVNDLFDESVETVDDDERAAIYTEIDKIVMEEAAVLPVVFDKGLLYRPENLTNVHFSNGFAMYDYMTLGTTNTE